MNTGGVGTASLRSGTSIGGVAGVQAPFGMLFAPTATSFDIGAAVTFPTYLATSPAYARVGYFNDSSVAVTSGVYFQCYNGETINCITNNAGTTTVRDTGIAISGVQQLRIIMTKGGVGVANAEFYVDGNLEETITTNFPAFVSGGSIGARIDKNGGTTQMKMDVTAMKIKLEDASKVTQYI